MKKIISLLLVIVMCLACCIPSFAAESKTLDTTDITVSPVTAQADKVTFSGTAGSAVSAVMTELLCGTDVLAMYSVPVVDGKYSGTIEDLNLTSSNSYTFKAANYDGGNWVTVENVQVPQYTVVLSSWNNTNKTASVAELTGGGTYDAGASVTITAPKKAGFDFLGWYVASSENNHDYSGDTAVSNNLSYTFGISSGVSYVAVYASRGTATVNISVCGESGKFTVNDDTTEQTSVSNLTVNIGSVLKITAVNKDNVSRWTNGNGSQLGTGSTLEITVNSNMDIKLYYKGATTNQAFVEYISDYNQIIFAASYSKSMKETDINVPAGPSKSGYIFSAWEYTPEKILTMIGNGETHIVVSPTYTKDETKYEVTVYIDGTLKSTEDYYSGDVVTVTADDVEGKTFACWKDGTGETANILGYSTTYRFVATSDKSVYAVYGDVPAEAKPVVNITNIYKSTSGTHKISFEATRSVPDGYTVEEVGMLYNKGTADFTSTDMVIGGAGVSQYVDSSTSNNGAFTLNVNVSGLEDKTIWCRGYIKVVNESTGNTETYYTQQVSEIYTVK